MLPFVLSCVASTYTWLYLGNRPDGADARTYLGDIVTELNLFSFPHQEASPNCFKNVRYQQLTRLLKIMVMEVWVSTVNLCKVARCPGNTLA